MAATALKDEELDVFARQLPAYAHRSCLSDVAVDAMKQGRPWSNDTMLDPTLTQIEAAVRKARGSKQWTRSQERFVETWTLGIARSVNYHADVDGVRTWWESTDDDTVIPDGVEVPELVLPRTTESIYPTLTYQPGDVLYPCSPRQARFIKLLLSERDWTGEDPAVVALFTAIADGTLDRESLDKHTGKMGTGLDIAGKDASIIINRLRELPLLPREDTTFTRQEGGVDLSDLPDGYYAVPNGKSRLKVLIQHGGPTHTGKDWTGWVFVKDGAEYGQGRKYGSQRPGSTYQGDIEDELTVISRNPQAAAQAYGRLVGNCARCGRVLEDEESVRLGIGPICRKKAADEFGWSF